MIKRYTELKAIKESSEDYEAIEQKIKEIFKEKIYLPLVREFYPGRLTNAKEGFLLAAIQRGQVTYDSGKMSGQFNAQISRELRELGARWNRSTHQWEIPTSLLPREVRHAISASEGAFRKKIDGIDQKLAQLSPEEIAGHLSIEKNFDRVLWKVDRDFKSSVQGITIAPKLTDEARKRIAKEWQENLKLYIKDFAEEEILELRKNIKKSVFAGNRHESAVKSIQTSYGVSQNKAKFLARQETALLMAKFKETRYESAGVKEYKWMCVSGSKNHPVRPSHKILEGKIYRWDDPPITTGAGESSRRNNPGQDYNCRCYAKPIVRF